MPIHMVFMDSLPTIKEKLAFKNKLITNGFLC